MRVTSVHVSGIVFVLVVFISVGCYCNQFQDAVLLVQHSEKSIQSKSFPFDNPETQIRREAVKNAFIHAWEGYKRCGWGSDDVKPISCAPSNWISQDPYPLVTKRFEKGIQHCKEDGLATTLIDNLDTLWLLGLNEEFDYAVNFIENQLCINKPQSVNIFETVIRVLGGLLSGYHLSKNPVLLSTAQELTDRLLPAFDTPYSFPKAQINLRDPDKSVSWDATVALAEVGSNILEFSYLSKLTNDAKYETIAKKILKSIFEAGKQFGKGYYPTNIRLKQGQFPADNLLSFAGKADSFFEYLVKYSILENSRNSTKKYLDAYNLAMKTMLPDLLVKSRDVAYLSDANVRYRVFIDSLNHVSHLSCFAPGLFALESAWTGNETRSALSKILLESCIKLYKDSPTGLAPDECKFNRKTGVCEPSFKEFHLRPETVESLFVMYRVTGDSKYQDQAWEIFQAFESKAKVENGYAIIKDVTCVDCENNWIDLQPSYFLSETLKYLYLIFSPDDLWSLDEFVFTTEAHPIPFEITHQ